MMLLIAKKAESDHLANALNIIQTDDTDEKLNFPIVGIGASAGGLAAFESFFSGILSDADSAMAYVLVQHLSPEHKSILAELISHYTSMQVFKVEDGIMIQPNCVYVIPPGQNMALLNGTLQLLEPTEPQGHRLPIDFFFRSLAQDQREKAIAIVLTGTGSDGTLGIQAIKSEGGMVMVQSLDSAEYDGMPRSAISTGLVDYALPPAEMPAKLIEYVSHAFRIPPSTSSFPTLQYENSFKKIFILLRAQTGHDFSLYKPTTIHRRIERRMAVHQIDEIDRYIKFLQNAPTEVVALFRDLLIGVTNFFRDPDAFIVLEEHIISKLFIGKPEGSVIRIWSTGCSTGEEAYSIAILLQEYMEAMKLHYVIQIFATDIDAQAIAKARTGLFSSSIEADITPERLARFFTATPDGDTYRIHKNIRNMLIFSEHNIIKDPPFSKLDLISCRNLLIYMGTELQKKLFPLFHYALNSNGILFLGTSESIGDFNDLFFIMDRKAKIYQRKEHLYSAKRTSRKQILPSISTIHTVMSQPVGKSSERKLPLRELTEQTLLQQIAPSGALVNTKGDILYLYGHMGMYLELPAGETNGINILKMAREGLHRDLTIALHKAVSLKEIVRYPSLSININGNFSTLSLTIRPVVATIDPTITSESPLYLVILEEVSLIEAQRVQQIALQALSEGDGSNLEDHLRIELLTKELWAKEEYLQIANEEMENYNEKLKSSNEYMQSINEELHSTNEELETSKEELQSTNEELATVNTELQTKVSDLSLANNDMNNLLAGTGVGTVFVNHQLRILRFTPEAKMIINLMAGDEGRPVSHIGSNLIGYIHLVEDVQAVLDTLIPKEMDVQTAIGKWYTMRILPYRTIDNVIEGAVITFIDNTARKEAEEALYKAGALQRAIFNSSNFSSIATDVNGVIQIFNVGAEKMLGYSATDVMNKITPADISDPKEIVERAQTLSLEFNTTIAPGFEALVFKASREIEDIYELTYVRKDGSRFPAVVSVTALRDDQNNIIGYLLIGTDNTARKEAAEAQLKVNELLRLAVVVRDAHDAITVQSLDGTILAWNPGAVRMYGWSETEALKMNVRDRIPKSLQEEALVRVHQLSQAEILEPLFTQRIRKDTQTVDVWLTATALVNESGNIYAVATTERIIESKINTIGSNL